MSASVPTFSVSLDVTRRCNLRCRHCFNYSGEGYVPFELDDDTLLSVCHQIRELPIESVCLCGGEPLIRKDLVLQMVSVLSQSQITVNMTTNGMLMTDDIAMKLKSAGIGNVQISVDGVGESHNWLRNNSDAFGAAISAIKTLVECGIDVGVACTPSKRNINEIPELMNLLDSLGVSIFRMQPLMALGRAKSLEGSYLSQEDYTRLSLALSKDSSEKRYKMTLEWGDPTQHLYYLASGRCSKLISINSQGEILLSPYLPISFGNISRHSLDEYLDHGLRTITVNNPEFGRFLVSFSKTILNPKVTSDLPELYRGDMIQMDIIDDDLKSRVHNLINLVEGIL